MSEYKRWIAYVYSYDNGNKGNNIGYARVEMRESKSKITIHINVLSVTEPMKVYLYVRENGRMKGIYIGDIYVRKGTGDASFVLNSQSIENSAYGMRDVCGLIIYHNENKYFGSEWDDKPIELKYSEGIKADESVNDSDTPPAVMQYEEEMPEEECVEPEASEDTDIQSEEIPEPSSDDDLTQTESHKERVADAAEEMMAKYPRMYPFEDDEMLWCIRIEPQDIGHLPIDTWVIANNSFLLHGYYSYRHLVLMKTADKYHPSYLIGVPGVYHNKDEFMAKMFGFELFKPMSSKEDMRGEFGYWCISITDIV